MESNMKLTHEQLQLLIKEVTNTINEQHEFIVPTVDGHLNRLGDDLLVQLSEKWNNEYDEGDPSMTALGKDAWNLQVDRAVQQVVELVLHESNLYDVVTHAIDEIYGRLINGEYWEVERGMAYDR